jgi:hypothetical protein
MMSARSRSALRRSWAKSEDVGLNVSAHYQSDKTQLLTLLKKRAVAWGKAFPSTSGLRENL